MALDTNKTTTQKRWPLLGVTEGEGTSDAELWVTHQATVKNVGQPTETTTHDWDAELRVGRTKLTVARSSGMAEFDAALNTLRQAIVDARNSLITM